MAVKVSVVVPVYNVEPYIAQCIDSLLAQTLKETEIIIVDDGSPDKSGVIADAYAEKDTRVKVIHQPNMGLGPARNSGMKIATGEYIGFVDSDDWVKPEMYERLYNAALLNDADIAVGGYCEMAYGEVQIVGVHPMAGRTASSDSEIYEIRKGLFGIGLQDKESEPLPMSVWASIYRREMIESSGVKFIHVLSEDILFNIYAYQYARKICFIDAIDYCYRKDNQISITHSFSERRRGDYREFLELLSEMMKKEKSEELELRVKRKAIDCCRTYVGLVQKSDSSMYDKRSFVKAFCEDNTINVHWENYPIKYLPIQQRVFHGMILSKCYYIALLLCGIRDKLKWII